MVDALETTPPQGRHAAGGPAVPAPQVATPPSLSELISEAYKLLRRDGLPFSGHIVVERRGTAAHHHNVWLLGPFALVEGGWFGQVLGAVNAKGRAPRWLRNHEKTCTAEHWTQFISIDETALSPGCGLAGVGLGIGPDGPTYCAVTAGTGSGAGSDTGDHVHVPMVKVLRHGLRELADRAER